MVTPAMTRHFNNCISNLPTTLSLYNTTIREAVNQGFPHKALYLFRQMKQTTSLEPNNLTFPFIAKACAKLSSISSSQMIHALIIKSPFHYDKYVQTAMVDMYVKCNKLDYAYYMFKRMPERDVASWNAMIVGFGQLGYTDRVCDLFREMRFGGVRPDSVTAVGLVQSVMYAKDSKAVECIYCLGIKIGVESDVSVANTFMAAYSKSGELGLAEMVISGIEMGLRTVVSWNSMIAGYAYCEKYCDAFGVFKLMLYNGFRPDVSTIVSLISSCVVSKALLQGKMAHSHGIRIGCDLSVTVANTLISMYCKCGEIESAQYLFDGMCNKSCVSWTAMIGGYSEKGDLDEALGLFKSMELAGERPDLVTVVSLISGCGQTGALELGKWVDAYATSNELNINIMVSNALIDMYAKCGSIPDARKIFYNMPDRTVVSWTTMIAGCALNGEFNESLDLFVGMMESGMKPNHITFLAVLQACTHAGFLEKGWECFKLMTTEYNLTPGLDHYSCMTDLLGRRGKLKEALEFINNMPIKPDAGIWGALLSACKIHRDIEIGLYVAQCLLELEPQSAVLYVEMANIYASAQRWDGVARIRTMMNSKKVKKLPGHSILQLNGKSHVFTVDDNCHPECVDIYGALDGLTLQMIKDDFSMELEEEFDKELDREFSYN